MLIFNTVARPYAKAIFELAIEQKSIKKWKEMLIFMNKVILFKKFQKFLSGSLSPKFLSSFFILIAGDYINEDARNLIKLLAKNQRFKIFKDILRAFLRLELIYQGYVSVKLISASYLSDDQIFHIRSILEKKLLSRIKFVYKIDPYLLNGILVKINDTVFDFSLRNHFKQLSDSLNILRE
ncbi:F0F1 ATP synthase subunit delta [Buchnera aphidicola (Melanaphis sacchari)]|uniref:ATP synthase subunit delta n=1 Tax=Buchnera aphidicola (Melanaphis sacchari) TaxID=2173854 RepID=A0A2U8DGB6_9GAMM|nr:ATP synthase F1 subunit delta [Buchnera aphidicola]AWH90747.1 F0F1 ATP synthase subunit delta [Buchnera aphidicola (Melanaphis sacchari)]